MAVSKHGAAVRGMDNVPRSSVRDQRFGRMFRNLPPADFDEEALIALGQTMQQGEFADKIVKGEFLDTPLRVAEPSDENPSIPSGYTYLGQFIDHDVTFDPMSSLDRFNDPDALQDFRTPRLDLDSIYGSGPADQPYLYGSDGKHMLLGEDRDFNSARAEKRDLPRNNGRPRRALIGDKRNDENSIVSQLHATFLRFHNRVLDDPAHGAGDFARTQRIVRWHYQWIVLHDFIPRVVGEDVYKRVTGGKRGVPDVRFYDAKGLYAYIPIEFSAAAYRFGHSMVRPSYSLSTVIPPGLPTPPTPGGPGAFHRIPIFSIVPPGVDPTFKNLNGFRELPILWGVDWSLFFDGIDADTSVRPLPDIPDGATLQPLPQPSYKLDTTLVDPLTLLPEFKDSEPDVRRHSLAVRNLLRGWRMELPSGQSVARRMGTKAIEDAALFDSEDEDRRTKRQALLAAPASNFVGNCPLWFYILREAELLGGSSHLGPVGGTIVAEVLAGLIQEDRQSFLSQWPDWTPELPRAIDDHFTMADLINFAEGRS